MAITNHNAVGQRAKNPATPCATASGQTRRAFGLLVSDEDMSFEEQVIVFLERYMELVTAFVLHSIDLTLVVDTSGAEFYSSANIGESAGSVTLLVFPNVDCEVT